MLGSLRGNHPARGLHDSRWTDWIGCCTGARLARRPHARCMRDGRSLLGGLEDVYSTRGLLDGRLTGSIERLTPGQVQMNGRSSEVARPTLGSLEYARSSARGLLHSRSTASADGRLIGSTGRLTGAQRA